MGALKGKRSCAASPSSSRVSSAPQSSILRTPHRPYFLRLSRGHGRRLGRRRRVAALQGRRGRRGAHEPPPQAAFAAARRRGHLHKLGRRRRSASSGDRLEQRVSQEAKRCSAASAGQPRRTAVRPLSPRRWMTRSLWRRSTRLTHSPRLRGAPPSPRSPR